MDKLFEKYTASFDAFDATAIAGLYRLPCAVSDADGVQTFSERAQLIEKFSANCSTMHNFGYQRAQFNILNTQELGQDKCAVTIGWRIITTGSNIDFRTLYICHKVNNAWLIFNANVYQGSFNKANRVAGGF